MVDNINYNTFVFDCDGVILNSNTVKTQAFYQAALPFGVAAANALVDYHTTNGGISRYKKFAHFCEVLLTQLPPEFHNPDINALLDIYATQVREGLVTCKAAEGLLQLRELTPNATWMIVSGGDQTELREIFAERGLDHLFDGGIFGSPDTKDEILARELASGNIQKLALFLGDSKYDCQAARRAGLDFIFVSQWTEVKDWQSWVQQEGIKTISSINQLITGFS